MQFFSKSFERPRLAGGRLSEPTQHNIAELPEQFSDQDQVLREFVRLALLEFGSEVVSRIILFGSRATGSARDDSDYDVALVVPNQKTAERLVARANDLGYAFLLRGAEVRPVVLSAERLTEHTHFLEHIRRVGRDLLGSDAA